MNYNFELVFLLFGLCILIYIIHKKYFKLEGFEVKKKHEEFKIMHVILDELCNLKSNNLVNYTFRNDTICHQRNTKMFDNDSKIKTYHDNSDSFFELIKNKQEKENNNCNIKTFDELIKFVGLNDKSRSIIDYRIMGSYDSCRYGNNKYSSKMLIFLFNIGVKYFHFNIIKPGESGSKNIFNEGDTFYVHSGSDGTNLKQLKLEEVLLTIKKCHNKLNFSNLNNQCNKKGKINLSLGSPNNNDPIILHFKLCIKNKELYYENSKEIFKKLYNLLNKHLKNHIYKKHTYFDTMDCNNNRDEKHNDIFSIPVTLLEGKIIIFFDIFTEFSTPDTKLKDTTNKMKNIYNNFCGGDCNNNSTPKYENLASLCHYLITEHQYQNNKRYHISSVYPYKHCNNSIHKITKIKAGNYSDSHEDLKRSFTIIEPNTHYRFKPGDKKGTHRYIDLFNESSGINIIPFAFYNSINSKKELRTYLNEFYEKNNKWLSNSN